MTASEFLFDLTKSDLPKLAATLMRDIETEAGSPPVTYMANFHQPASGHIASDKAFRQLRAKLEGSSSN